MRKTYGEDGKGMGGGGPAGWYLLVCHVPSCTGTRGGGCTCPLDGGDRGWRREGMRIVWGMGRVGHGGGNGVEWGGT